MQTLEDSKNYRHEELQKAITRDTDIKALCKQINISRPTFYRVVNKRGARIRNIKAVAAALGVPLEKVFS